MEWLVSNLENSQQCKLPMWMLLAQIYWQYLLRLRKYGRRLVTALVSHYHLVSTSHSATDLTETHTHSRSARYIFTLIETSSNPSYLHSPVSSTPCSRARPRILSLLRFGPSISAR